MYTVKDLLESSKNLQIRLIGKNLGGGVDREIKGIRIVEELDTEKYLSGGEILLTRLRAYEGMGKEQFLYHLEELNKKEISGFIIKRHPEVQTSLFDILLEFCEVHHIPVLEMDRNISYWIIIKYVVSRVFNVEIAKQVYFKLIHDDFSKVLLSELNMVVAIDNILALLNKMLDNPVTLYHNNYMCYKSTELNMPDFVMTEDVEEFKPNIITGYQYYRQKRENVELIHKIDLNGKMELFFVITERNRELTGLDFICLEGAIKFIQFVLMRILVKEELDETHRKELKYRLLNGSLTREEEDEVANILDLNEMDTLRVIDFRILPKHKKGKFTNEQIQETEVIERELLCRLPRKYITSNINQIIYIDKIDEKESELQCRLKIEKLQKSIQINLDKRNTEIELIVSIGKTIKGYHSLSQSFYDSKMAIEHIDLIRKIMGDEKKSVIECSMLGFFRVFANIKDKDELLSYIPESLHKLYEYDKQKNGDLINTLECYLNNKQSVKQTSKQIFVHYRTVVYRLQKIADVSGMDYDNATEMLTVRNGLIIYRLIEEMQNHVV